MKCSEFKIAFLNAFKIWNFCAWFVVIFEYNFYCFRNGCYDVKSIIIKFAFLDAFISWN